MSSAKRQIEAELAENADNAEGLPISLIRTDGGTQPRSVTDADTVNKYAYEMQDGAVFPAVVVYFDGDVHWLAAGFHRYHAAIATGVDRIRAEVRQGTQRDAILFSVGENAEHGLPRTRDDKRRAVIKLLEDQEWSTWSDNRLAELAHVSQAFVSELRNELEPPTYGAPKIRMAQRGNSEYQINTANIGGNRRVDPGHREHEERSRIIACAEALRSVIIAHRALPDPDSAASLEPNFPLVDATRIGKWWHMFNTALRQRHQGDA